MGLISALAAALFIAASNLFMRRNLDASGTAKVFLVIQMATAFAIALFMGPIKSGSYAINLPIIILGLFTGLCLAFMLYVLGRALEKGPPGLTFSILSSATVMPGVVMASFFGAAYTVWHALGSMLVLAGLFWAGKGLQGMKDLRAWVSLVTLLFALHVVILVIYQWRALVLSLPSPILSSEEARSEWFMPMLYLGATLVELLIFFNSAPRKPYVQELMYGSLAGLFNWICTFFLLQATELAKGVENAVIFPLFSIGTIFFSNLWGQYLYQEKVNWRACQVCASGIFLGTVDWKAIILALGLG